jgi:hypothetical protein
LGAACGERENNVYTILVLFIYLLLSLFILFMGTQKWVTTPTMGATMD